MEQERIILGIDPGTNVMGYALLEVKGNRAKLMKMDVINLKGVSSHELKLKNIFDSLIGIIESYHPDFLAIEAPFFGKNVQSMLKLGRAQGIAIAAALSRDIPYQEYSPKKIKQSITGNGNASKEQVAYMLQTLLHFNENPSFLDATDAMGAAYCHYLQKNDLVEKEIELSKDKIPKKRSNSWNQFIEKNPNRIN